MRRSIVVALLALLGMTGCPSVSTTGLARTLNQGAMQGFVSPGFVTIEGIWLPQIEVGGRYGLNDHLEVGAKAWLIGAGMDLKWSLLRARSMQSGFDLALDPSVSYFGVGAAAGAGAETQGFGLLTVGLPVLAGINFSGHQLMIGPKLVGHRGFGTTGATGGGLLTSTGTLVGAGASVGLALKLGGEFRIMPEVSYVRYLWSDAGTTPTGAIIQGGVSFLFGGGYDPPPGKQ